MIEIDDNISNDLDHAVYSIQILEIRFHDMM